jgi:purine-binding chemotaxis protein CheW
LVLSGAAPVALAVDAVDSLVTVAAGEIESAPAEIARRPGEQLRGAFQVRGRGEAAKILDVWPLLESAFVQPPRPAHTLAVAEARAAGEAAESEDAERIVTFQLAGQEFALPLDEVREIIPPPDSFAAVPTAEALVLGMMAYRGALLPVMSLRGLLGLPAATSFDGREKILVTAVGPALVGLLVDRMRAIVSAARGEVDPTPPMLAARIGGESRVRGIYRGEGGRRLISILAADQLFREDVMHRLGDAGVGGAAAQPTAAAEEDERRFVVFQLGEDEFALPIEAVDEVARAPDKVAKVPKAPKFLEGVINLRGEVLPVVDQRRRFDMPPCERPEARRLIVVRTERHRAGVIVDGVSEVLRTSSEKIGPAPHLAGEANRLVNGVVSLEASGRILLLLDPAELLSRAERSLLDAFQADAPQAPS